MHTVTVYTWVHTQYPFPMMYGTYMCTCSLSHRPPLGFTDLLCIPEPPPLNHLRDGGTRDSEWVNGTTMLIEFTSSRGLLS